MTGNGQAAGFTRTLPHDIAAEQVTLGAMMLGASGVIADVAQIIKPADHYRPAHQMVHETILALWENGKPADPVTVADELDKRGELRQAGGAPYLHTLIAAVPVAANGAHFARIVLDEAIKRRLAEAGTRIIQWAHEGDGEAPSLYERARAEVESVMDPLAGDGAKSAGDLFFETLDSLDPGVPQPERVGTPYEDLTCLTTGFGPGELVVVAARPALGKSVCALDCVRHAALDLGVPSVLFSLEMSRREIMMRMISAEARVPLHAMRSRQIADDDWGRIERVREKITAAPLFIDDSPNMTLGWFRSQLQALRRTARPGLVVVDYLQLMTGPGRAENRQVEVAGFSRGLKMLAKEFEVPVIAISQLNRGPEQRTDKRPLLSDLRESGCMTEDTALLRADTGVPVTFGELMRDGWEGVPVWSVDERHRLVAAPVTEVFASGTKEAYRLRLASGREVKASANHPFLIFSGWVPLGNLRPDDRIAIPRRIPEPINSGLGWSEYRIGLLAHLLGDGCVLRSQPVHYTSNDEENLAFVEAAAATEFGISPRRVAQETWWHTYLPAPHRCTRGRGNPLHAWFRELGIENLRSYEKHLPAVIYTASDAEVCLFLHHLWATDGCVYQGSKRSGARVYYSSSSRKLAYGVADLLARLGIVARIRQVEKAGSRPGYHVIVRDGPSLRTFCERVGVHGRRGDTARELATALAGRRVNTNVDTIPAAVWDVVKAERVRAGLTERQFQAAIGTHYCGSTLYKAHPSRERLTRCAEVLNSEVLREVASSDLYWDRVVSIEPLGPQLVYDATVKGTHNFIADGLVAHNSIEQDSDVVILLHREDAYERDSPRAGEADFIVAKHRNGPTAVVTVAFQGHYSRFVDMARDYNQSPAPSSRRPASSAWTTHTEKAGAQ